MKPPTISGLVHVGLDILTTTVNAATKRILAQTGDVVKDATDTDGAEWWQHVGFASRPPKPQAGKQAAQAVVLKTSDRDVIVGSVDQRGLDLYGNLDHGESCLYAAGEDGEAQARILLKKNGSINLFTKSGNTSDGEGMGIFVNPSGEISVASHNGAALLIGSDGSVKLFNASGALQVSATGAVKLSSVASVAVSAPSITLGGSASSAAVVNVTDLASFATLVSAAITASGAPSAAGAVSAFQAAVTALVSDLVASKRTSAD